MPNETYLHNLDLAFKLHGKKKKGDIFAPSSDQTRADHESELKAKMEIKNLIGMSFATSIGKRFIQEDRVAIARFPDLELNSLVDKEIETALNETFKQLGEQTKQFTQCGSTLVTCLIVDNRVFTANVGDSRAFAARKKQEEVDVIPLNWAHKPEAEGKKINELGVEITKGYIHLPQTNKHINGRLAMSRAFGDHNLLSAIYGNNLNQIYIPDITKIVLENNEETYIIVCTDGVTDMMETIDIQMFIAEHNFAITAQDLVIEAHSRYIQYADKNKGRGWGNINICDNISAVVINTKSIEHPTLIWAADGHGGSECVNHIHYNLGSILNSELLKINKRQVQEQSETKTSQAKPDCDTPTNRLSL